MSSSPPAAPDAAALETYQAAWSAIFDRIRRGDSWSGNERNCVFLNCGGAAARFANVSSVSGLDFPDDGRAVATADWDGDGDLDLWLRNRTAPRLRLMLNRSERNPRRNGFLSVELEGTRGNRDAIGARVTVMLPGEGPLMQTLRAGDAFLSQASKTLHFGIGTASEIRSVTVRWPNGNTESFSGVTPNSRALLVEGTAKAKPRSEAARPIALDAQPQLAAADRARASILLPRRVPLPPLAFRATAATDSPSALEPSDRPLLLLFWASWCPACEAELRELAARQGDLAAAGLDVLALAVDGLDSNGRASTETDAAADLLARTGFPFAHGFATVELLDTLRLLEEHLFDRYPDFAVPYGFLLSPQRELVAIYRGRVPVESILFDARHVAKPDDELRDLALPFPGRWYTRPYSRLQMLEHLADLTGPRAPDLGLHYLELAAAETPPGVQRDELARRLAVRHYQRGLGLMDDPSQWERCLAHFKQAITHDPGFAEAYHAHGAIEGNLGRLREARASLEKALELKPGDAEVQRKLRILSGAEQK